MKLFYWLAVLLYLLLLPLSLQAQSDLRFEHLTEKEGLSNNAVTSIYQDREGFMWFGTEDGLNRFDGNEFKIFRPDPRNLQHTLKETLIRAMYEDRRGRFWVGTYGLQLLNKHTDTFTTYMVDSTRFTYLNIALTIHEDKKGLLWFSAGGGLNRFDPTTKKFNSYLLPELTPNLGLAEDERGNFWMGSGAGLYQFNSQKGEFTSYPLPDTTNPHPFITALLLDSEGILWIGTNGAGLFRLDTRRSPAHAVTYNPEKQLNKIISNNGIMEDNAGYIWLATKEGLQQINKKRNQVSTYRANPDIPSSLSSNEVLSVYQDKARTLWVGTDKGINKLITYTKPFHSYQIKLGTGDTQLEENKINSLLEDQDGMVWLGTAKGLYTFDPRTNESTYIHLSPASSHQFSASERAQRLYIFVIQEDQAGRICVGTSAGLYLVNRKNGTFTHFPCNIPIERMALDSSSKLWIPGGDGKTGHAVMAVFDIQTLQFSYTDYALNDSTGLKDMYMHGIIASRTSDIWIAAGMHGISHMNYQTKKFTHILPNPKWPNTIIENYIRSIYEDKNGIIWAGSHLGGLFRLDPNTGVFTNFTTHEGLPSNHITSIIEDEKGNLWLGTNNGLSCFDPLRHTFRNFNVSDGLPDNTFRFASVYRRHHKLYFGSHNGFVVFNPDSIQEGVSTFPVYITAIKVLEKKQSLPKGKLELAYNENFISFDFTALDYHAPERIQYAYMLENTNEGWIQSGKRRYAAFTNLDPGEYVFRVKASNTDDVWNGKTASLQIIIHPPFWRTTWAYLFYIFIALGLLYRFRQFTLNRERMKNAFRLKQVEAQKLQELEAVRSRFFANISHEFRTPLTLILGPLEKLIKASEEHQHQAIYRMMEHNARRLLHLINQLLDLSKLESGNLKLENKAGNVNEFFHILAASFSSLAESRNIDFRTHFASTNDVLLFDKDKIEKIVMNLLSNAFKFKLDGGTIEFLSTIQEMAGNKQTVELEMIVTDSGIGISPEETEKIFDRFYQVDGSQTREKEGTGIGLALTKELVDLHKGTIVVESEKGKGVTFIVRLPLMIQEKIYQKVPSLPEVSSNNTYNFIPEPSTIQKISSENRAEDKPLLLIVEDNQQLSAYIASHFTANFQVTETANGKQGLQQALTTIPDIIISDVMMPQMDGIELCRRLKTDECTSHIPLILLTAKAGEKDKLEGLETGADDYLTKPFSGAELQTRVHNLLESRKRLRERFSREVTLQPADVAITSADEKFLERIMAIVEANFMEADFSPEVFEKEAGLSRTQFYRKMKALTNQAPGEFLRNFRLQKAVMLLKSGHGNVSQVAYSVGFNSLAYFTRCFKEYYGQSPTEYMATHMAAE